MEAPAVLRRRRPRHHPDRISRRESARAPLGRIERVLAPKALTESDVLVISTPLTPETTGIIGAAQLEALGPEGLLVNVARGPIVQEEALYAALKHHGIAGAAIDVWYRYPAADGLGKPSTLPFESLDNVIMTPHSSAVTEETFRGRSQEIIENINRLDAGRPVRNVVMAGSIRPAPDPEP